MLSVFMPFSGHRNASTFYRMENPATALTTLTPLPIDITMDDGSMQVDNNIRVQKWSLSDIIFLWNPTSQSLIDNMLLMKSWKPGLNNKGDIQWPPSYIVSTDDAMFDVQPYNPQYKTIGINHLDGRLVMPGESVYVKLPDEDSPREVYKDGTKGFNARKNLETLNRLKQIYLTADEIIVSTVELQKYMKDVLGKNSVVIPNCVDVNDFPKLELKDHPEEIRILWQGSSTHVEDMWDVEDALVRVMEKYPNTKFISWGTMSATLMKKIDMSRTTVLPYRPFQESGYYARLASLNYDINLAPLSNTKFAACRSGIKWYEAGALGKPTLAAKVGPYLEITDDVDGLTYETPEEFEQKLSLLIESAELRQRLGGASREWVIENRNPAKWAYKYFEVFENVRKKMREERPYQSNLEI